MLRAPAKSRPPPPAQHVIDVMPGEFSGAQQSVSASPVRGPARTVASLRWPAATGACARTGGWHACGSRPPTSAPAWPGSRPAPVPAASSRWRSARSAPVPARRPGPRAGAAAAAHPRLLRDLRCRARPGLRRQVSGAGAFGHDVGRVALAAAAHADVERLPPGRLVHDQVRGVDRAALRDVHVPRVGQVGVLLRCTLGQLERRGPRTSPVRGSRPVTRRTSATRASPISSHPSMRSTSRLASRRPGSPASMRSFWRATIRSPTPATLPSRSSARSSVATRPSAASSSLARRASSAAWTFVVTSSTDALPLRWSASHRW